MSESLILNVATQGADCELDVVFIHGLGGHHHSTWTFVPPKTLLEKVLRPQKSSSRFFWPERLSADFSVADVWTIGYPADAFSWRNGQSMPIIDRATNILQLMHLKGLGRRPTVYIAHSLGGLVLKQMLRAGASQENPDWRKIAESAVGILFLATPHAGSYLASIANSLRIVTRATWSIEGLRANETYLRDLDNWFRTYFQDTEMLCHALRETKKTHGTMVVDATSADPKIHNVSVIPVDKNHLTICKPSDVNDQVYLEACSFVQLCIEHARLRRRRTIRESRLQVALTSWEIKKPCRDHAGDFESDWKSRMLDYCDKVIPAYLNVRTLIHRTEVCIDDIYVPPNVRIGDRIVENASYGDLLDSSSQLLIFGAGGAGKSFLCKRILIDLARSRLSAPVLVRLRELKPTGDSFNLLKESYEVAGRAGLECTPGEFYDALRNGEITLLLDGFDELETEFRFTTETALSSLLQKIRAKNVIVTSRPIDGFLNRSLCLSAEIMPVDADKSKRLIERLKLGPKERAELLSAIQELFEQEDAIVSTPLLLTVFAITFDVYGQSLQQRMSLFYERAFDALWIMHDRTKDGFFYRPRATQLSAAEFQEVLGAFACITYLTETVQVYSFSTTIQYLGTALRAFGHDEKTSPEDFLNQLVEALGLFIKDGANYEFTHRSFQEYYTAFFFSRSSPQRLTDHCRELVRRGSSENVLYFIGQIDPNLFEQSVVIPELDRIIGYSDETCEADYATYVGRASGIIEGSQTRTGDSKCEFYWQMALEVAAFFQVVRKFYPSFPEFSFEFRVPTTDGLKELILKLALTQDQENQKAIAKQKEKNRKPSSDQKVFDQDNGCNR